MKVTNEQAQLDIAKYLYHSETKKTVSPLIKKNYAYAADILEARDFIKEMREVLEQTRKYLPQVSSLPRIETEQGNCVKTLISVLHRTKDYAE